MTTDVTTRRTSVQLELESLPANVMLVRSVVAAFAEVSSLDVAIQDRIRTAVSEAANNVVLHAYDDGPGSMHVSIAAAAEGIGVLVADRGHGIRPVLRSSDRMGLGLAVISALSDRAEFVSAPEGGTQVRLLFALDGDSRSPPYDEDRADHDVSGDASRLTGDIVVSLAPVTALGEILGRLSRAVAAQRHFRVDRIGDLRGVTTAIAAVTAEHDLHHAVEFAISADDRRIDVTVGPLPAGTTELLARSPVTGSDSTLAEVVDQLSVAASSTEGEYLRLLMIDARPLDGRQHWRQAS